VSGSSKCDGTISESVQNISSQAVKKVIAAIPPKVHIKPRTTHARYFRREVKLMRDHPIGCSGSALEQKMRNQCP
jgi:hypothetical protein